MLRMVAGVEVCPAMAPQDLAVTDQRCITKRRRCTRVRSIITAKAIRKSTTTKGIRKSTTTKGIRKSTTTKKINRLTIHRVKRITTTVVDEASTAKAIHLRGTPTGESGDWPRISTNPTEMKKRHL